MQITIAELTFKVNQIKNLSALPVKIARIISSQQDEQPNTKSISATSAPVIHQAAPIEDSAVESMENVAAEISASNTSVPQRRRRQAKRSFVPHYKSDFNTDTDDNDKDSDWERPCPKMVGFHCINNIQLCDYKFILHALIGENQSIGLSKD